MNVDALNCPNCGAAVASDRTQCEFCRSRLKTMACPTCLGLMFVGNQFCGHCGAKMVVAEVRDADDMGNCPRCRIAMVALSIGSTNVRECRRCDGMWADVETFEHLCSVREEQSAVLGFIGARERSVEPLAKVSYVPCPDCSQLMNRSNFARASGVIIDTCKKHGIWFDAGELPQIIEFIQKGGMEIARQRERNEIENERSKLRDEQLKLGVLNRTFDESDRFGRSDEFGISSILRRLFE